MFIPLGAGRVPCRAQAATDRCSYPWQLNCDVAVAMRPLRFNRVPLGMAAHSPFAAQGR
jgi:hypothetical protein